MQKLKLYYDFHFNSTSLYFLIFELVHWYSFPLIAFIVSQEFVNEVLHTIELDEIKDSLVGMPNISGLSTEQRKRLTIATELVANPSIIFLDEPTSGLDARAAAVVMRAVKNVVGTGRTVTCTIHQPSIDIFEAFDEVNYNYLISFAHIVISEVMVVPFEPDYPITQAHHFHF